MYYPYTDKNGQPILWEFINLDNPQPSKENKSGIKIHQIFTDSEGMKIVEEALKQNQN